MVQTRKQTSLIAANKLPFDNPTNYGLVIKPSKIHGLGVFANTAIKKGQLICPYNYKPGNKMKWLDFKEQYGTEDLTYTYSNRRKWEIICVKNNRNIITFINDGRPDENVKLKSYALYALRDINAGEEILLKYPHYCPN